MSPHKLLERVEQAVWSDSLSGMPTAQRVLIRAIRITYTGIRDLSSGELNLRAMSLVFTTMLALVPLLALSFSVLKGFGIHNQMEPLLASLLAPLGENATEISRYILEFVANVKVTLLGTVGLGLLVFTAVSLLQKTEAAFNTIWKVPRRGHFARRIGEHMGALFLAPLLGFSILGLLRTAQASAWFSQLMEIPFFFVVIGLAQYVTPLVLTSVVFTFIYSYMPNTRVKISAALSGGIIAAFLWEFIRWAFAAFVSGTNNYDAIYSGFAAGVFFLMWLYVSWMVLLLGAVFSFYIQHPQHLRFRRPPDSLYGRELERVGLAIMALLAHQFYHGLKPVRSEDMARRFGLPFRPISAVLQRLCQSGFIARTDDDEESWLLTRDARNLAVYRIINELRHEDTNRARGMGRELGAIDEAMKRIEKAVETELGNQMLIDLVKEESIQTALIEVVE